MIDFSWGLSNSSYRENSSDMSFLCPETTNAAECEVNHVIFIRFASNFHG